MFSFSRREGVGTATYCVDTCFRLLRIASQQEELTRTQKQTATQPQKRIRELEGQIVSLKVSQTFFRCVRKRKVPLTCPHTLMTSSVHSRKPFGALNRVAHQATRGQMILQVVKDHPPLQRVAYHAWHFHDRTWNLQKLKPCRQVCSCRHCVAKRLQVLSPLCDKIYAWPFW